MLTRSDGQAWIEGLKGFLARIVARIALAWERVEPMARRQKAIMVHSA
jgi:hypothetical protein